MCSSDLAARPEPAPEPANHHPSSTGHGPAQEAMGHQCRPSRILHGSPVTSPRAVTATGTEASSTTSASSGVAKTRLGAGPGIRPGQGRSTGRSPTGRSRNRPHSASGTHIGEWGVLKAT